MGFFKEVSKEFGKKTGKAIGNKLYGAYADDKRVGVNRGKLKGESDGVKITGGTSGMEYEAFQSSKQLKKIAKIEKKQRQHELDIEKQRQYHQETQQEQQQNQYLLEKIMDVELEAGNKESLLKSLTTLSIYVDLCHKKGSELGEHLAVAQSKYDTALAMLQVIDSANPMTIHFLQKRTAWEVKKRKENREILFIVIGSLIFILVMGVLALLGVFDNW